MEQHRSRCDVIPRGWEFLAIAVFFCNEHRGLIAENKPTLKEQRAQLEADTRMVQSATQCSFLFARDASRRRFPHGGIVLINTSRRIQWQHSAENPTADQRNRYRTILARVCTVYRVVSLEPYMAARNPNKTPVFRSFNDLRMNLKNCFGCSLSYHKFVALQTGHTLANAHFWIQRRDSNYDVFSL